MKYLLALLLLLPSPAMSCESFEECVNQEVIIKKDNWSNQGKEIAVQMNQNLSLRAIAYKLDEISKKLDKPEKPKWPKESFFYTKDELVDTAV